VKTSPALALAATLVLAAAGLSPAATPAASVPVFRKVAGEIRRVQIRPGDTLGSLASAHGVGAQSIVRDNRIENPDALLPGQVLDLDTRRIVPELTDNGLVADIAGGIVYRFEGGRLASRYPAGFGSPTRQTPTGVFSVLSSGIKSDRAYPASPQEEKSREAAVARLKTLPDPPYSLGPCWIQLSQWGLGIHATTFASTIGEHKGNVQIRLSENDAVKLTESLKPGARVTSVYLPVRLALTADGGIWLEAHRDVYNRGSPGAHDVLAALGDNASAVDKTLLRKTLEKCQGVATLIGKTARTTGEETPAPGDNLYAPAADWKCLDCPPGPQRRVTLRVEALRPIALEGEFPLEVRDETGKIVYRSASSQPSPTNLAPGEALNLVWECTDSEGLPLAPGSYTALVLFKTSNGRQSSLSLPLWLPK
jgi:lipoprotein-anchoring transpeptidase ErfK/SrfK